MDRGSDSNPAPGQPLDQPDLEGHDAASKRAHDRESPDGLAEDGPGDPGAFSRQPLEALHGTVHLAVRFSLLTSWAELQGTFRAPFG